MVAALTVVACETQTATESATASRAAERAGTPAPVIVAPGTVLFEYQVEEPVTPAAGTVAPRYPDELRKAGVTGEVLAQFVVDTSGKADVATFKVLNQPNEAFVNAVKGALPQMRFNPAKVGGRAIETAGRAAVHLFTRSLMRSPTVRLSDMGLTPRTDTLRGAGHSIDQTDGSSAAGVL